MINLGEITRNVRLKHRITHTEFKIPPLAPMDLNRKHFGDERAPVDSMLNYLATNVDEILDEATGDSGIEVDKVTSKVKNQVQNWVETDVWVPIRKYVIIIVGSIIALVLLTITVKFLIRYKCCRIKNSTKTREREAPQVFIMRKGRNKPVRSGPSEQAEALV